MDAIKKAFYDVMYKYEKCFSEQGVIANLKAWSENKGSLISLLRCHQIGRASCRERVSHGV